LAKKGKGNMPKEKYVIEVDNVSVVVKFVNAPKNEGKGYSYKLNVKNPIPELKPYLDKFSGITMFTFDKEPRFAPNQDLTIAKLGISQWQAKDGTTRYSAHSIHDEKPKIFEGTKKEPAPLPTPLKESPTNYSEIYKTPDPEDEPVDPTKKMWADKELRDFRGRCLMYASNCFTPKNNEDQTSEIDRADQLICVAEKLIDYIYNGYLAPKESCLKDDAE